MKPKGKKEEELNQLKKDLAEAKNLIVAQFKGMTVAQDTDLRQKIRATNSKYRVVKNTLARIAAKGTPAEGLAKSFEGSTCDRLQQLRSRCAGKGSDRLREDQSAVCFQGGHGRRPRRQSSPTCNAIASLPSKEELIAKLLFLLNAPAQRIAVATNGVARNLAVVVGQAVEQKKFQE